MGAWGYRSFENDDAMDWVNHILKTPDTSFLEDAFEDVQGDNSQSLNLCKSCRALAAAEMVAASGRNEVAHLPEEVALLVKTIGPIAPELFSKALLCVRRIMENSELRDLWEESNEYSCWEADVQGLFARLSVNLPGTSSSDGLELKPFRPNRGKRKPGFKKPETKRIKPTESVLAVGLRDKAVRFLQGIVPFDGYTSESETEDLIRRYIDGRPWNEPCLKDCLRLSYSVLLNELAEKHFLDYPEEQRAYISGCADILREIMLEIYGKAEPFEDIG
ncbi:MAG: DUF4259 domain-containing protein [Candidatus Riflebacteria bacterium]